MPRRYMRRNESQDLQLEYRKNVPLDDVRMPPCIEDFGRLNHHRLQLASNYISGFAETRTTLGGR